jgi:hypothetical protein
LLVGDKASVARVLIFFVLIAGVYEKKRFGAVKKGSAKERFNVCRWVELKSVWAQSSYEQPLAVFHHI